MFYPYENECTMKLNKIHTTDCIDGMKNKIDPKSIDVIVTSPPYNIGMKYNSYSDSIPYDSYLEWMSEFGSLCHWVLKDNGSLFLNIGDKASEGFRSFDVAQKISKSLDLQNTIHWIKSIAIPEHNINVGHFKPINSQRYLNNLHEYIFHFTKSKNNIIDKISIGVDYADKSNINRWNIGKENGGKRDRGNVWFIPYDTICSKKEHPASFPKKLPEMCIKLHGYNTDTIILDPFSGIGTTCLVAKEMGCKWIGFEIDKKYSEISKRVLYL